MDDGSGEVVLVVDHEGLAEALLRQAPHLFLKINAPMATIMIMATARHTHTKTHQNTQEGETRIR
jgi:hypothetical protein